jgi:hypothetical protein
VEVRDPADDRGTVDHVRRALESGARLRCLAQIPGVDLGALADPIGCLALVADAHLEVRIAHQPAHNRLSDHPGAAGHEHATHGCGSSAV